MFWIDEIKSGVGGLALDTPALKRFAGVMASVLLAAAAWFFIVRRDAGTTLLMLRLNAVPTPSVAETRWSIVAAPSRALEADAPGAPAFDLELLRWRGGPAGTHWRLDWDKDEQAFRDAALSGAVLPLAAHRAVHPLGAKAA